MKSDKKRPRTRTRQACKLLLLAALLVGLVYGLWTISSQRAEGEEQLSHLAVLTHKAHVAITALSAVHGAVNTSSPAPVFSLRDSSAGAKSVSHPILPPILPSLSARSSPPSQAVRFTLEEEAQARVTLNKVACLRQGRGAVMLYHTRKCAGTTLRSYLSAVARQWGVRFVEAEGDSLHRDFLSWPGLLTATSLRHPVERALSLYWYEHVAWYNEVTHEMHKCKPLSVWVEAWADGSPWKRQFLAKNPASVYVEVQNYFVKSLSGWTGSQGPASREHLQAAKRALESLDVVLLAEQLGAENTSALLEHTFGHPRHPGRGGGAALLQQQSNKADPQERQRLRALLASDQDAVVARLQQLNALDLELWAFAQHLVGRRGALAAGYYRALGGSHGHQRQGAGGAGAGGGGGVSSCGAEGRGRGSRLSPLLEKRLGIFRPPGHKGPLD